VVVIVVGGGGGGWIVVIEGEVVGCVSSTRNGDHL